MTSRSEKILSCDWGSSSLRVRLFDPSDNTVLGKYSGDQGIIATHQKWLDNPDQNRIEFYKRKLRQYLDALQSSLSEDISGLPLVISGMASSTIGMMSLPYADLPFSIDGNALQTCKIPPSENFPNPLLLVSGVRASADVMRGEETELIGFASAIEGSRDGLYIFPGTHSKHILVKSGTAMSFKTFMTGEIFALVCGQSILRSAVHKGEFSIDENNAAFKEGVSRSRDKNLLNQFFTLRASELFSIRSKEANYFFLSGLLIGYELSSLENGAGAAIYLCVHGEILKLYKTALLVLGHEDKTRTFSTQRSDTAVAVGQYRIYQNNH